MYKNLQKCFMKLLTEGKDDASNGKQIIIM